MKKELSENSKVEVSLKTLGGIGVLIATLVGMWFQLNASIEEAKMLPEPPPPEVTKMEFDMKDQMIRATIMTTQEDVTEIKEDIKYLRDKIDTIDDKITDLLVKRFNIVKEIGAIKLNSSTEITNLSREKSIISRIFKRTNENISQSDLSEIFNSIFEISKKIQNRIKNEK